MLSRIAIVAAICLAFQSANPAIVRVPSEFETIQAALNSIQADDTVLVAQGEYVEALIAPPFGFALIGDVPIDTGLFERPVVDPSTLENSDSLACLRTNNGEVYVERIWFRNRNQMFPHDGNSGGGIVNGFSHLYLTDCVFDSTYRGVLSIFAPVTALRCVFIRSVGSCLRLSDAPVVARHCFFECINTDWSAVIGGSNSTIEYCQWQGFMGLWEWWLALGGENYRVTNCVFGPGGGSNMPLIHLVGHDSEVKNNLFTRCESRGYVVDLNGGCDGVQAFTNNQFVNTDLHFDDDEGFACLIFGGQVDGLSQPCISSLVESNTFEGTEGGLAASAVSALGPDGLFHNQFRDLNSPAHFAVKVSCEDVVIRDNIFSNTVLAVESENQNYVDARYNWWGHQSGPYNSTNNPLGHGDEVSNGVDFIPWHTDTLFFTDSPEPRPPLPESASLFAYPNPFNQTTTLQLTVPRAGIVRVELFDITGRRVQELWSGPLVGKQEIIWTAENDATGLYFVRAWDPLGNRPLAMTKVVLLK